MLFEKAKNLVPTNRKCINTLYFPVYSHFLFFFFLGKTKELHKKRNTAVHYENKKKTLTIINPVIHLARFKLNKTKSQPMEQDKIYFSGFVIICLVLRMFRFFIRKSRQRF